MEWLNYHHLLYFWMVAREGTVVAASRKLRLAQPTVTGQIRALENSLGQALFRKAGRRLELTDVGRIVYSYADEIFSLGRELQDVLGGRPSGRPLRLVVGVSDVLPKLIAYELLKPALELPEPVRVICHEDKPDRLLSELSAHSLDVVLSDAPVNPGGSLRVFNHLLGSCAVSFMAKATLARKLRARFPESLDGAPFLLPMHTSAIRRALEQWFEKHHLRPKVTGEFQDNALLEVFGQSGVGVFAAPTAIERQVKQQYAVSVVGRTEELHQNFYAISVERKLKHPAVLAISDSARRRLFEKSTEPADAS